MGCTQGAESELSDASESEVESEFESELEVEELLEERDDPESSSPSSLSELDSDSELELLVLADSEEEDDDDDDDDASEDDIVVEAFSRVFLAFATNAACCEMLASGGRMRGFVEDGVLACICFLLASKAAMAADAPPAPDMEDMELIIGKLGIGGGRSGGSTAFEVDALEEVGVLVCLW